MSYVSGTRKAELPVQEGSSGRGNLTSRQMEFLDAFRSLVERGEGISPTLKELADELQVRQSTIRYFVRRMTAKGYLTGQKGKFRTLRAL
jgi:DNA-binding MarR family transcriptional regulator